MTFLRAMSIREALLPSASMGLSLSPWEREVLAEGGDKMLWGPFFASVVLRPRASRP